MPPRSPTTTPAWARLSPAARRVGGLRCCWHLISLEKPRPQLLPPAHRALLAAPLCLGNCGASAAGVALKTEPPGIRGLCVCGVCVGVLGEEDPGFTPYTHLPLLSPGARTVTGAGGGEVCWPPGRRGRAGAAATVATPPRGLSQARTPAPVLISPEGTLPRGPRGVLGHHGQQLSPKMLLVTTVTSTLSSRVAPTPFLPPRTQTGTEHALLASGPPHPCTAGGQQRLPGWEMTSGRACPLPPRSQRLSHLLASGRFRASLTEGLPLGLTGAWPSAPGGRGVGWQECVTWPAARGPEGRRLLPTWFRLRCRWVAAGLVQK